MQHLWIQARYDCFPSLSLTERNFTGTDCLREAGRIKGALGACRYRGLFLPTEGTSSFSFPSAHLFTIICFRQWSCFRFLFSCFLKIRLHCSTPYTFLRFFLPAYSLFTYFLHTTTSTIFCLFLAFFYHTCFKPFVERVFGGGVARVKAHATLSVGSVLLCFTLSHIL